MEWTATAKELETSGFRIGLDKIFKDFKYMYMVIIPVTGGMIYFGIFAPRGYLITDFTAIVPLANQIGCHALLPVSFSCLSATLHEANRNSVCTWTRVEPSDVMFLIGLACYVFQRRSIRIGLGFGSPAYTCQVLLLANKNGGIVRWKEDKEDVVVEGLEEEGCDLHI